MTIPNSVNTPEASNDESVIDVIDQVLQIDASHPLYEIRQGRPKVVVAMQKNYATFFAPQAGGLSQKDRLLVAWYACNLSNCAVLQQHYMQRLADIGVYEAELQSLFADSSLTSISEPRLRVILLFTNKLILNPIEGDANEIQKLCQADVATPDIVTLAQLISFLSYQIRVVISFLAMKERLEK